MARTVPEWIGKNDDAMPGQKVRQRILEREKCTCYLCGGEIQDGQGFHLDHKNELKDGGENRETNLFPVHPKCHKRKSAEAAMERAPIERKKHKHTGAARPKGTLKSRGFDKTDKPRKIDKDALPQLARPQLYQRKEA